MKKTPENARQLVKILLNQIEELSAALRDARVEIQQLRDENDRLKGEQGNPKIKANISKPAAEHSSEKERHKTRERHKKNKKASLVVSREEVATINPAIRPSDAVFKGYEKVKATRT